MEASTLHHDKALTSRMVLSLTAIHAIPISEPVPCPYNGDSDEVELELNRVGYDRVGLCLVERTVGSEFYFRNSQCTCHGEL